MQFFPRFEEVTGYDQFVALFALVLIDRCNDLSIGFLTVIENRSFVFC